MKRQFLKNRRTMAVLCYGPYCKLNVHLCVEILWQVEGEVRLDAASAPRPAAGHLVTRRWCVFTVRFALITSIDFGQFNVSH